MAHPSTSPKRPRGILKNSASYQNSSPDDRISPTSEAPTVTSPPFGESDGQVENRPGMPPRELSEKEITQMNTELNAGNGHRRSSSNVRSSISRRQSSNSANGTATTNGDHDESSARLKWDEANLYLNEGQMGGKMKIDEPKTPYAKQYDPAGDEEELENINAEDIAVDELDMRPRTRKSSGPRAKETEIPGLDIGEPEIEPLNGTESDSERKVQVSSDSMDLHGGRHGEEKVEDMSHEELEKHKKFEEARKKHYEMKNIKNLLGHSQDLDAMEDDDAR